MMKRISLLVLMCSLLLSSVCAQASVEVNINGVLYSFSTKPRLTEVLSQVADQNSWYWPNSRLFKNQSTISRKLHEQTKALLNENSSQDNRYTSSYTSIAQQLNSWKLLDRVLIDIDFDLARISQSKNPLFEPANYQLLLTQRPSKLYIFGAINQALVLPYPNNTCIHDIMAGINLLPGADNSQAFIIKASGEIRVVATAYFNKQCESIAPGSTIYIPLQEGLLLKQHSNINLKIAQLAIHRTQVQ